MVGGNHWEDIKSCMIRHDACGKIGAFRSIMDFVTLKRSKLTSIEWAADPELDMVQGSQQANESNGPMHGSKGPLTRSKVQQDQVPLAHGLFIQGSKFHKGSRIGFVMASSPIKSCVTWVDY
uniref:Uncharacterized protein n=1 Tax=Chenopodium quinoa TaxID=63459 RepID=A0A803KR55_CHEQI